MPNAYTDCANCDRPAGDDAIVVTRDERYCRECWDQIVCRRCRDALPLEGMRYCVECSRCDSCGGRISDEQVFKLRYQRGLYCDACAPFQADQCCDSPALRRLHHGHVSIPGWLLKGIVSAPEAFRELHKRVGALLDEERIKFYGAAGDGCHYDPSTQRAIFKEPNDETAPD